jgi:hypothetical protein
MMNAKQPNQHLMPLLYLIERIEEHISIHGNIYVTVPFMGIKKYEGSYITDYGGSTKGHGTALSS